MQCWWFPPSSFFHPRLEWTSQLSPLLGVGEVDKLNVKLRSLNVSGLLPHFYQIVFPAQLVRSKLAAGWNFSLLPFPRNGCLYELLVAGLDRLKLSYKQFFPSPFLQTEQAEMQFTELLTTIGSWPQVCILSFVFSSRFCDNSVEFSGREGIRFSIPCAAVLPGHAGPGREKAGRRLPAQVCHSTPEIPHQQVSWAQNIFFTHKSWSLPLCSRYTSNK